MSTWLETFGSRGIGVGKGVECPSKDRILEWKKGSGDGRGGDQGKGMREEVEVRGWVNARLKDKRAEKKGGR